MLTSPLARPPTFAALDACSREGAGMEAVGYVTVAGLITLTLLAFALGAAIGVARARREGDERVWRRGILRGLLGIAILAGIGASLLAVTVGQNYWSGMQSKRDHAWVVPLKDGMRPGNARQALAEFSQTSAPRPQAWGKRDQLLIGMLNDLDSAWTTDDLDALAQLPRPPPGWRGRVQARRDEFRNLHETAGVYAGQVQGVNDLRSYVYAMGRRCRTTPTDCAAQTDIDTWRSVETMVSSSFKEDYMYPERERIQRDVALTLQLVFRHSRAAE